MFKQTFSLSNASTLLFSFVFRGET